MTLCTFGTHKRAVWESCSVKFIMIFAQGKRDNKEPPLQQPGKAGVDTAQWGAAANLCSEFLQRHSPRCSSFPRMDVTTALQHRSWAKLTRNKPESDAFRNEAMAYFYFLTPGKWLTLEQTVTCLDWFSVSTATWFYVIEHVMRLTK